MRHAGRVDGAEYPDRGAVAFQFDVPLTQLKPGCMCAR